jgi:hypothetical protein
LDFQASEIWIWDQLMGWDHFVCADGDHLALFVNERNNEGQTIEFGEIFLFDFELLSVKFDDSVDVLSCLDENFLVLACEHVGHVFDIAEMFIPWSGQLCELEIVITEDKVKKYLQNNFLKGKLVQPLKLRP